MGRGRLAQQVQFTRLAVRAHDCFQPKVQESEDSTTISLAVSIDGKGQLFLKGTKVDVNNLRTSLGQQAIINPNVKVTLAADSKLPYQQVADTLSAIKQAGVSQVALITQK